MGIGKLISLTTKVGLGGGIVYYAYELGLWKNSDETIKNYEILKRDVNDFLDSSPALVGYLKSAGDSIEEATKPVTQPVSDFRKEWLNFDCPGTGDGIVKTSWNKGVGFIVDAIASSPQTVKIWSVSGWNKIQELASNSEASASSTDSASNKNTSSS